MGSSKQTSGSDSAIPTRLLSETRHSRILAQLGFSVKGITAYGYTLSVLQRGLCYQPSDNDLQEALQQILAEMAKTMNRRDAALNYGVVPMMNLRAVIFSAGSF